MIFLNIPVYFMFQDFDNILSGEIHLKIPNLILLYILDFSSFRQRQEPQQSFIEKCARRNKY